MSKSVVTIVYCRQCNWMLRAAWLAQELLSTFSDELKKVELVPATGGVFRIEVDGDPIWDRARERGFPGAAEAKRRVRDRVASGRHLGHLDSTGKTGADEDGP